MINRDTIVQTGIFRKPHGKHGEMVFTFTDESFTSENCPFLICEIDGIFVPFRIASYRFTSGSAAYIKLKGINSDQEAREFTNKEAFFPKEFWVEKFSNREECRDDFVGFVMIDEELGKIGSIVDIDKTTINTLFVVEKDNEEILIPAAEEFIIGMDEDKKELFVNLPIGLILR